MLKKFLIAAGIVLVALVPTTIANAEHDAIEDHCLNHNGHPDKDESGADDNDLVVEEGTLICVKAGNEESDGGATGFIVADGETTLQEYLEEAGIVDGTGEQGRDVSYWIDYGPAPRVFVCVDGVVVEVFELDNELDVLDGVEVGDDCEEETTTTTAPPVTTTTEPPVTTTTLPAPPLTLAPPAPVVAPPVALPAPVAAPAPAPSLPVTGAAPMLLAFAGALAVASGLAMRFLFRNNN